MNLFAEQYDVSLAYILGLHVFIFVSLLLCLIFYLLWLFKLRSKKYELQSCIDYETGLWNVKGFEENLVRVMSGTKKCYAITEFNIRGFAHINKLYGPARCDMISGLLAEELNVYYNCKNRSLKEIRDIIYLNKKGPLGNATAAMNVAKINGDTFVVVKEVKEEHDKYLEELQVFQKELQEKLRREMHVSLVLKSGTVFSCIEEKLTLAQVRYLMDSAHYARTSKKNSMLDNVSVYDDRLKSIRETEEKVDAVIEDALVHEEFYNVFQPKVDPKTGKIKGVETLVRWKRCDEKEFTVEKLIRSLEKNGYIEQLDFYIYRKTFEYMESLMKEGLELVPFSLNVSRFCFDTEEFVSKFHQLFLQYNIPPSMVELEIEERVVNPEGDGIYEMVRRLKDYGFTVSMDDFGSGESSLNMLSEIPVDVIKLDKGFLRKAESSESSRIILEAIINMAKKVGKKVVCEGVETEQQVNILREMGCDLVQGYYYSKPLDDKEFKDYLVANI